MGRRLVKVNQRKRVLVRTALLVVQSRVPAHVCRSLTDGPPFTCAGRTREGDDRGLPEMRGGSSASAKSSLPWARVNRSWAASCARRRNAVRWSRFFSSRHMRCSRWLSSCSVTDSRRWLRPANVDATRKVRARCVRKRDRHFSTPRPSASCLLKHSPFVCARSLSTRHRCLSLNARVHDRIDVTSSCCATSSKNLILLS